MSKNIFDNEENEDNEINEEYLKELVINCEKPNGITSEFYGRINHINDITINECLTIENILLRGTTIQNTDIVIGCVIFSGKETKSEYCSNKHYSEKVYFILFFFKYNFSFFFLLIFIN